MEFVWRPQSRTPLSVHVHQRLYFAKQDFKIAIQNETLMQNKIEQIKELHHALESAEQNLRDHINTWDTTKLNTSIQRLIVVGRPEQIKQKQDYTWWIQGDLIRDDTGSKILNTWRKKYSELQTEIDKLRLRISIKIESANNIFNCQTKFFQPVFGSF